MVGGIATGALADAIWGLYRKLKSKKAKLELIGKDFEGKSLSIQFEPSNYCWSLMGDYDEIEKLEKLTPERIACLEALRVLGKQTVAEVAKYMGKKDSSNTRQKLNALVDSGYLGKDTNEKGTTIYFLIQQNTYPTTPTLFSNGEGIEGRVGGTSAIKAGEAIEGLFGENVKVLGDAEI